MTAERLFVVRIRWREQDAEGEERDREWSDTLSATAFWRIYKMLLDMAVVPEAKHTLDLAEVA